MEDSYVLQMLTPKFKDFHLCFCGYSQCEPMHSYGPAVRPNYIIHYVLDGKGYYLVGEKRYDVSKGQGFLIEPEVSTFYQADEKEPWTYLWVGFGGTQAKHFLQDIGLHSGQLIFQGNYGEELKQIVFNMLKHTDSTSSNLYYLQGMLYEFFSVLAKDTVIERASEISKENIYIEEAISYIRNYYANGISVEDIAVHLNLNRSYLYTLFKKNLNMTPKEFLTRFRISRAKEQLTLTDFSVENIAKSCGYRDTLVFSKAFKALVGLTPTAYRKEERDKTRKRLLMGQQKLDKMLVTGKKYIK